MPLRFIATSSVSLPLPFTTGAGRDEGGLERSDVFQGDPTNYACLAICQPLPLNMPTRPHWWLFFDSSSTVLRLSNTDEADAPSNCCA